MKSNVKKSMFRILFYLRKNEINKLGNCSIMVRITINKENVQFSSKLQVRPELWDTENNKVIGRSVEAINTNRILNAMRVKIEEVYHSQLNEYGYVLPEKIKNIILGLDTDKKKMLLQYFDEHNEFYLLKIGKDTSQITYNRYLLTKDRLQEFLREQYNLSDIPIFELTPIFIERFFIYIQEKYKLNNNSALKFIQRFRTVFFYIKNTGADIKADPFASFKFKTKKVVREVLSQEEIDTIYTKVFLTERLSQIRDVFIFMCYTGLSYIDVAQLTDENIEIAFDGHPWIMTRRQKTDIPSNIRLLEVPLAIIERYKEKQENRQLFPICSNQKMNEYLEETAAI